jgi:predicted nucleic acid-binding protein
VTLVDTSVWIDHIRAPEEGLVRLLSADRVLMHPHVIGEVMLGSLRQRAVVLRELRLLPQAVLADDDEALEFIEREALFGLGIGYVDAHLLASARLTGGTKLWARDRRLAAVATRLGLAFSLPH